MITIRPGSHVLTLLSILPFVGEYPMSALRLLGSVRSYKELIHKLTQVQEFRFPDRDERFTCRLLNVCGRGNRKMVRFHKSALPLLQWWDADMYRLYMEEYDNHNFSGNARHVNRNHLLAETAVMCLKAGVDVNPLDTPEMLEDDIKELRCSNPFFYFAREVKRAYKEEMNKIRFTRLAGVLTLQDGVYTVYNLRNEVPNWMGEGESKVLWHMESMFYPIREEEHPYHRSALIFGENYDVALSLMQTIRETKKLDYGLFRSFFRIRYIPMNDFGVWFLRLVTSDNWRENLLLSLFEPKQCTTSWGGLSFNVFVDGIDTYCFLDGDIRNLFNFRDTILMRNEGLLPRNTIRGHKVICYPEQLAFVQEFFGDLVEYATVTMDAVESALELDRPSLID